MDECDTQDGWKPMSSAPTEGFPIQHVRGKLRDGSVVEDMHYAYDHSGEYQPPFEGWFKRVGNTHIKVKPVAWMPKDE